MGKYGRRKKKGGVDKHNQNQNSAANINPLPVSNGGVDLNSSIFLKRAHEFKEEGNKRFQAKDYVGALEQYNNALELTPKTHPERAVFHSNRAACLMQMKPVDYEAVIAECSMALLVRPKFVRALLRRARAFEATGMYELAMQDVQVLLGFNPNHRDALKISCRVRTAMRDRQGDQRDLQSRPSTAAALGASAVRGAAFACLGPCLSARPAPKKAAALVGRFKPEKTNPVLPTENGLLKMPKLVVKPSNDSSKRNSNLVKNTRQEYTCFSSSEATTTRCRPLKLVYGHDIRLAEMPVHCNFNVLRKIVGKRFPPLKSVLIKFKDHDGDLVTGTCTSELRLAESFVDSLMMPKDPDTDKSDLIGMLRLHIIEVSPEHEPTVIEDEEEEHSLVSEGTRGDKIGWHSSLSDSVIETMEIEEDGKIEEIALEERQVESEEPDCKEVEMDDWLFEFAQLFRTHIGIDPDAHIDLHELGMELCSEALEEAVTSEDAQSLFDKAAVKFQEVVALAFFNWGNVHMCAARKRIAFNESASKDLVASQLQAAYDWAKEKYSLARKKYEEALVIKPNFCEGFLALGQQQFEMAKLHWSYVLAKNEDLSEWKPTETIELFDNAEEKMRAATEIWEKMEEQRAKESEDPSSIKGEEFLQRRTKQANGSEGEAMQGDSSSDEVAEQAAVMRSQIHLCWGNMLFERSQVE